MLLYPASPPRDSAPMSQCSVPPSSQTFLSIRVKEGLRKKGADRPSIIMVGSFVGKASAMLKPWDVNVHQSL